MNAFVGQLIRVYLRPATLSCYVIYREKIPLFLYFGRVIIWPVLISKGIRPKPGSCILSDASGPFVGDRSELDPHNRRGLQLTKIVVRWDLSNLCV